MKQQNRRQANAYDVLTELTGYRHSRRRRVISAIFIFHIFTQDTLKYIYTFKHKRANKQTNKAKE